VPTYQYVCTNPEGKHDFEVVQSFSDAPVAECPECASPVRKVYGSVGVVFKGSGFYRTDSRKAGSSAESSSNGSSTTGSSSTGSSSNGSSSKETASTSSSSSAGSAGAKAAAS
jgi:putative FmdB family regulatory protein